MNELDAIAIFRVLDAHDVDYVLVGGMAGVVHGSMMATFDVDITPRMDDDNLQRLGDALRSFNARIRSEADPHGIAFDPHPALLASMRMLNLSTDHGALDLTIEPSGVGGYDNWIVGASAIEIDGIMVDVAGLDDIITSKEAADRDKDRAALPILRVLRDEIGQA